MGFFVTNLLRHLFRLFQYAEEVLPEDLSHRFVGMAPREEASRERRQLADLFHADRHARDAVPIRADAHVVRPRDFDREIKMIQQRIQRRLGDGVLRKLLSHQSTSLAGVSVRGGVLYTTFCPCLMCTKMIINAGIEEVAYNAAYPLGDVSLTLLREAGVKVRQVALDT